MVPVFKDDRSGFQKRIRKDGFLNDKRVMTVVMDIMEDVYENRDRALFRYTKKFDGFDLTGENMLVTDEEIKQAYLEVDKDLLKVIQDVCINVAAYSMKQKEQGFLWDKNEGITIGQRITPLKRVGVYIPGGTAPLISSVIMNAMPAYIAGVKEVIMCTPPPIDAARIVAAKEAHVSRIYRVGGAQAVFAMAFGTESIKKCDKITGPGNIYVAYAKKLAYGFCGIDMVAGPSEIMIIADEKADPVFIAADMLGQAEHDKLACSSLLTVSSELAKKVNIEIDRQLMTLKRTKIIEESLNNSGAIYVGKSILDCISLLNECAPEHAELMVEDPKAISHLVTDAGAVFLGAYSPEPLGDYYAGPNHTLPTGGTARFFSPLGVYDFMKKTSIISYSKDELEKVYKKIEKFADCEQLDAHANAVRVRFLEDKNE